MSRTIPEPTEGDRIMAEVAFNNVVGRSDIDPNTPGLESFKQSFVAVQAQQQAEIRWLRNMINPTDANANGEQRGS